MDDPAWNSFHFYPFSCTHYFYYYGYLKDQLLGNSVPSQTIETAGNTEPILDEEVETTNTIGDKIYRLQVGAYAQEENARKLADELDHKGFSAFVKHEDPTIKFKLVLFQ